MKTTHPALELFEKLFNAEAAEDTPRLYNYFVPRSTFQAELKKAGIEAPENIVDFWDWETKIGLQAHVRKIFAAYRKAHGMKMTPTERGAMRLERQMNRGVS